MLIESQNMIIFTHVPRTSGKYIESYLFPRRLKKIKKFHKKLMYIGQHGSYSIPGNIDILGGHVPFGIHNFLNTSCKEFKYIVFLRDPVKRWISEFNHSMVFPSFVRPIWKKYKNCDRFLDACISQGRNTNIMTKQISGLDKFDNVIQDYKNYMFMWAARKILYTDDQMQEMFEVAKSNLSNRYDYVGIVNSRHHKIMCKKFGWPYKKHIRVNVSSRSYVDWSAHLSTLNEINCYDIKLFEFVKDLCKKRLKTSSEKL